MKKIWMVLLLGLVCLTSAVWAKDAPLNIVFIPKSSEPVFWQIMLAGVNEAVREEGNIKLTWRGPAYDEDTDAQISILEFYSRPGVDAIVIAPTDRVRLALPIKKATEQGIKVIVVDTAVDGSSQQNFISTDNYAAGQLAARRLLELVGKQGNVALFRTVVSSASTEERSAGFVDYLKVHAPQLKVVADYYAGGSRGKAFHRVRTLLKTIGPVHGIFAVNESTTDGVLRALREAKLNGQVKLVGFDATEFFLEALDKQDLHGLIVQNPRQIGYLGIKAAVAAIKQQPMKERNLFTEARLVTRENFRQPAIQKLMCGNC